jgi:hypothetical protein
MSDSDDEWAGPERARLQALARDAAPPPGLEGRVVDALRTRGLIAPRRRPVWALAAAAAATFLLGIVLGRASAAGSGRPARSEGRAFALLLYPGEGLAPGAAAEQARVEEYRTWARGLAAQQRLVWGEKLKPPVRLLRGAAPAAAGDPEGRVLGFFLVRARTMEEAEAIARSCPHLRHGGAVAVREIDPT